MTVTEAPGRTSMQVRKRNGDSERLSIQTAAEMIGEEPQYSRLAARLLSGYIDRRSATRA